ncbi:hypothetical protein D5086_027108 [Populus alba]|uniref:Uncharacterized protein n=1 Tax=Populus alba TaxID=43335 RepID=A0ACC4B5E6_POPAL
MTIEAAMASNGWEVVKSKKARKSPGIPVGATHVADQVPTTPPKGKAPVISSSGGICTSECNPRIINNGKELVGAVLHRKDPHVVPVGTTTMCG